MSGELSEEQLVAERDKHQDWLAREPGVTGVGIGLGRDGRLCVKVYSNKLPAQKRNEIIDRFGDVPVEIEETGDIQAF